jgi:inosine/xanthosine triphosphatase
MTDLLASVRLVAIGSTNPVKVAAVRTVLTPHVGSAAFEAIAVASSVPDQPWGDDETIRGARTRAARARDLLNADLGVGIEGGVVDAAEGARTCAWAVVVARDGRTGTGGSLAMPLPAQVVQALREGVELGLAMDQLVSGTNTKHGAGAVGILTAGLIDRQRAYETLVTYALAPFLTPAYWD